MCGEHVNAEIRRMRNEGSSPHVRGAQLFVDLGDAVGGIIPACAGSTYV